MYVVKNSQLIYLFVFNIGSSYSIFIPLASFSNFKGFTSERGELLARAVKKLGKKKSDKKNVRERS